MPSIGKGRDLVLPPAQRACIDLVSFYEYMCADDDGFTTVAPTLGVRPGCNQYCTPSCACLSIYGWKQLLLMTLKVRADSEPEAGVWQGGGA